MIIQVLVHYLRRVGVLSFVESDSTAGISQGSADADVVLPFKEDVCSQ